MCTPLKDGKTFSLFVVSFHVCSAQLEYDSMLYISVSSVFHHGLHVIVE